MRSTKRKIGVAIDFSNGSKIALKWTIDNLLENGYKGDVLYIIHCNPLQDDQSLTVSSSSIPMRELHDKKVMGNCYELEHDLDVQKMIKYVSWQKQWTVVKKIYWGDARDNLCEAINHLKLDSLVMGRRGLGTIQRVLLGSVTSYVMANASCTVIVVEDPKSIGTNETTCPQDVNDQNSVVNQSAMQNTNTEQTTISEIEETAQLQQLSTDANEITCLQVASDHTSEVAKDDQNADKEGTSIAEIEDPAQLQQSATYTNEITCLQEVEDHSSECLKDQSSGQNTYKEQATMSEMKVTAQLQQSYISDGPWQGNDLGSTGGLNKYDWKKNNIGSRKTPRFSFSRGPLTNLWGKLIFSKSPGRGKV